MTRSLLLALLLAALPAQASPEAPGVPPITWIRLVDWDGQVFDFIGLYVDRVTDCGGALDWRDYDGQPGTLRIEAGGQTWAMRYEWRTYNEGGVTGNPNTTGDQVVYIQQRDSIFSDGGEACATW